MKKIVLITAIVLIVLAVGVAVTVLLIPQNVSDILGDNVSDISINFCKVTETDNTENVIYISDSAKPGGQGTSAQDPLYPTILPEEQLDPQSVEQTQADGSKKSVTIYTSYKNTALYQAFEKLSETGGTVVICGNYSIGSDEARHSNYYSIMEYHLPATKKPVTITSVYGEENYKNKAKLILKDHVFTILNGPTVWENLNIHTELIGEKAICCNGYKTVFGEGLNCTKSNASGASSYYLSIAGGARYEAINRSVDVTVKSGTFHKLLGTTWTNPGKEITCNCSVSLRVEGGTIATVYGNTHNTTTNSIHSGNVDITITDGNITDAIVCTGGGGFKSENNEVNIKILGGKFSPLIKIVSRRSGSAGKTGFDSKNINVDLGGANKVNRSHLGSMVSNLPEGAKIVYPASWVTTNRSVKSVPNDKYVYIGQELTAAGSIVEVEYKNPLLTSEKYNDTVEYTEGSTSFSVKCDTSKSGKTVAEYYFGDWKYHEAEIEVIDVPAVEVKGFEIKANSDKQQMYVWGGYEDADYPDVKIKSFGILSVPTAMLKIEDPFDHSNTYGMYDAVIKEKYKSNSDIVFGAIAFDTDVIKENNYNTDYSFRAYVKVECGGKESYVYSDVIECSLYDVAKSVLTDSLESEETKAVLDEKIIKVHDNYDPTYLYNPEGAEAARKQVVDYMYKMSNIEWTPKETFILYNEGTYNQYSVSAGSTRMYAVFYAGQVYRGIPYVNSKLTQYETFLDMIDSTSIIPLDNPNLVFDEKNGTKDFDNLTPAQKAAGLENAKNFPGNDCWGGLIYGWNSVLNSREETQKLTSIDNMLTLKYGTVKVGDYEIDERYIGSGSNNTTVIASKIDNQVMAEAYAKLQPGDATVYSTQIFNASTGKYTTNARHVRIVTSVEVVRKANNLIDLNASKVNFIHQAGGASSVYIYNSGDRSLGETSYTFRQLKDQGNLPMSIPELMTGNVDTPMAVASGVELGDTLPYKSLTGIVKSNKHMMSVRGVLSQDGKTVGEQKELVAPSYATVQISEFNLAGLDLSQIELKSGEKYTFDLYVCIAGLDGEEIHLVKGYEFTAK